MKIGPLFLLLTLGAAGRSLAVTAEEPVIPTAFPAERYETLIAKSPFAIATPVAPPPPAPDKSFADGWFIGSLARLEGKDFVTIKARDLSTSFTLYGEEPSNGVTLKLVEWSNAVGRSTVTIEKDGQTAKLEFNQAELQAAAASPPPGASPQSIPRPVGVPTGAPMNAPRPGIPRPTQSIVPAAAAKPAYNAPATMPQTNPGVVTGVPTNSGIRPSSVPPALPGAVNGPTDSRRRIRVINNVSQ